MLAREATKKELWRHLVLNHLSVEGFAFALAFAFAVPPTIDSIPRRP